MKTSLLSAFAAIGSASLAGAVAAATANSTGEYDYVVIGSGPGGGPLAYVDKIFFPSLFRTKTRENRTKKETLSFLLRCY